MVAEMPRKIISEVKKAVNGKDEVLWWILITMLAKGHVLIEDVPGVGKTTIALAFSKALGLSYGRVQFTPDVMPSDITGYTVYNKEKGEMIYQKGVVLCNLFLADELNRASSRTQSALLEALEEGQVTVDGISHSLPQPFIVIATQNPVGASGTNLLPDSQLDRFAIRMRIGYPSPKNERMMLLSRQENDPMEEIRCIVGRDEFLSMQKECASVYIKDEVADYIVALISETRIGGKIVRGASPRATLSVASLAKAVAYIGGRDYVIPDDVANVFTAALSHRVIVADTVRTDSDVEALLEETLSKVRMPGI